MIKMKIAHFSFGDTVGAFGAAYELHKYLKQYKVESTFFVRIKTRDDESIVELPFKNSIEQRLMRVINSWYFNENVREGNSLLSIHALGLKWDEELEQTLEKYDIFHIHWIPGLLSVENIYRLLALNKPVFWTMHDFNPFTGGCHYPEECNGYEQECLCCPQFKNNKYDIARCVLQEKINAYGNKITIIVASNWLKNIVKKSKVFCDSKCAIVPIGIDVSSFKVLDKKEAKKRLGISEEAKIILFGAQSLNLNVKGYVYLDKILKKIKVDSYFLNLISEDKFKIVTFGSGSKRIDYGNIPYKEFGYSEDRELLCDLYNAADVFIFPSVQETFGMVAAEAMACGTPVVAFDVCAMQDVIKNGVNGFKIPLGNYEEMFKCIKEIVQNNDFNRIRCRKRIVENYSLENEAQEIMKLYSNSFLQCKSFFKQKEWKESKEWKEFIQQCISDIKEGYALNQSMKYETIGIKYNSYFITPEKKVDALIEEGYLHKNVSVYIYGAGMRGREMLKALKRRRIKVIGFWDSDEQKWESIIDNYRVMQPYKKMKGNNNKIIIASMAYEAIAEYLLSIGYKNGDFY